jgi:hypothetical protein
LFDEEPDEHEPDPPDEPGPGDVGPPVPEPPTPDLADSDVSPDILKTFWKLVGIFNVALLATSLGLLLVAFEGRWTVGGVLVAVGLGAFLVGWRGYRRVRKG